ncbi:MAG TPA: flagellar hook-length control protein FliK [Geobacteraceae bacterium]|nr:flagellar hook-length control protein FliK [Geobacteraceae bacterium]
MDMLNIMSLSVMPQGPAGSIAADEVGCPLGKAAQSPLFGLMLDLCKETGGKGQSQSPAAGATDDAAAGQSQPAFADNIVKRLTGEAKTAAASTFAENGAANGPGDIPAFPAGMRDMLIQSGDPAQVQALPVLPESPEESKASGTSQLGETGESNSKKTESDPVWTPLFALGNLINGGNPTDPAKVSAATTKPQEDTAKGKAGEPQFANQPGIPADAAAAMALVAAGTAPDSSQIVPAAQILSAVPMFGALGRTSLSKEAAIDQTVLSGAGSTPAGPVANGPATVNITRAEGNFQEPKDMPLAGIKAVNGSPAEVPGMEAGKPVHGEGTAGQAVDSLAGRLKVEITGNAGKSGAADTAAPGSGESVVAANNLPHGKPLMGADAASAGGETDPGRVEIAIALEQEATRGETGEAPSRKTPEAKLTDSTASGSAAPAAADLRSVAESRTVASPPETRSLSAEQIVDQVRQKLDANGRAADNGQITLKLHPQELGELKISMRLDDHNLKVEIVTQNPSVKEALMQNIDTLKETLSRQNIAMERFDVTADARQGFSQGGRDDWQTAQQNRAASGIFQYAAEPENDGSPIPDYRWESENSLVNLML